VVRLRKRQIWLITAAAVCLGVVGLVLVLGPIASELPWNAP
jgi:hypothetical protein